MGSHNAVTGMQRPADSSANRTSYPRSNNVAFLERLMSTAVGGLLIAWGIKRRSALSIAAAIGGADLVYRGITGYCHLYATLGINTAASRGTGSRIDSNAPAVHRTITIGRSPEDLYRLWRDPATLAQIVGACAEVHPANGGLIHWRARGPLKQVIEWASRYTEEQPGRRLAWETAPGSGLRNRGEITFRPGPDGAGSEVRLSMQFEPPLGNIGAAETLHMIPRGIAGQTLRRFKSLAETGEIPTLQHNPSGHGDSDLF